MNAEVLIINTEADHIKIRLDSKFPELIIRAASKEEIAEKSIKTANILLFMNISDQLLKKAESLKWIHCMISGVDHLLSLPSIPSDILITATRGIHGPQMSELAALLMLALTRNFPEIIHNQDDRLWDRRPGKLLWKKKAGILGVGRIGKEIARICKAFGMTVYGITTKKRDIANVDYSFGTEGLHEVLGEVDYFINVLPSNERTKNIIGKEEFMVMKPSAYFINMGRGDTVDENAMINALENHQISGAALDVFREEPLPSDHQLWGIKNLILTPHIGGLSDIYIDQALPIFENNLRLFLEGKYDEILHRIW
ncbi:MAG: D-2-hydroxyacid dehydrogenase [Deltaproteobacteria bacterium]|nr:D-2-hydroxyacid dehydrogenase [Deltaproteobacteria bacterium]